MDRADSQLSHLFDSQCHDVHEHVDFFLAEPALR